MLLKIGELAKKAGLTVRTLHHYHHIGLLVPSIRSDGGFRLYNQNDVERLHRIQALKQFGCALAEIKEVLSLSGASVTTIIDRQLEVLQQRADHAMALHGRLKHIKIQLLRGEATGIDDWLPIIEMMTKYEKHLSKKDLDRLLAISSDGELRVDWARLVADVEDLITTETPPESREARETAWRWIQCVRTVTDNDNELAMKLAGILREDNQSLLSPPLSPTMVAYLNEAVVCARLAPLACYLTAGEWLAVKQRQLLYRLQWPALLAKIKKLLESGTQPTDPAAGQLAAAWLTLFHDSFSGYDWRLAKKLRTAMRLEPAIFKDTGIDKPLLDFINKAIWSWQNGDRIAAILKPTALRVAQMRALHQIIDAPTVFTDELALVILGEQEEQHLRENIASFTTPLMQGIRVSIVVRSRLAEEEWSRLYGDGVRQVVILGAGLDTFAYRYEQYSDVNFFEVDLPQVQEWKHRCLLAAGIKAGDRVHFVPIDFERMQLHEALEAAGFNSKKPSFFIWLGVTMYLDEEAIWTTLHFIAGLPVKTGVIFDYAVAMADLNTREQKVRQLLCSKTAAANEPWKTEFSPPALMADMKKLGFHSVIDYGPEQLNARFLADRRDGLKKGGSSRLICAQVARFDTPQS